MKPSYLMAAVLFLTSSGLGQTLSSHSGWSFSDTLATATGVLIGDIVQGTSVDNGSEVDVRANVHVVRVLSGSFATDADLILEWRYRPAPFETPAVTGKVPPLRALWFLRKSADGRLEPLQASSMMLSMGGYFLPVPVSAAPGDLAYREVQQLPQKLACEIAWAIEDLVTRHGPDFESHQPQAPAGGMLAPWVQTRNLYEALSSALAALDPKGAAGVYQYFSRLPNSNLRLLGLMGRLQGGEANALFEVEKDLPRLAAAPQAGRFSPAIIGLDFSKHLLAGHALARIALSETTIPGLEGVFAFQIGWTRNTEFLPYLIIMLESPDTATRDSALMGICQLLTPESGDRTRSQGNWRPEMAGSCPSHTPLNDRELERKAIGYWTDWWASQLDEMSKSVEFPRAVAPPRYGVPATAEWSEVASIPMEIRFQSLLGMSASGASHYHTNDGTLVDGPAPGPPNPLAARLSSGDREVLRTVISETEARLQAQLEQAQKMMNVARIAGASPDPTVSKALWAEHEAALKTGLQDLRTKLSPEGWNTVETFLMSLGITAGRPATPQPVRN